MARTTTMQRARRAPERPHPAEDGKNPPGYLADLLEETRIFLPGTQILAGFLITLPFTDRFGRLTVRQQNLYLAVLALLLLAVVCFIAPAAYHRVARPIHDKQAYKVLATRFIIVGMVPFSLGLLLSTYLIVEVVRGPALALAITAALAIPVFLLWWLFPRLRLHDRLATTTPED